MVINPRMELIRPGVGAAVAEPASRAAERAAEIRMVNGLTVPVPKREGSREEVRR